MGGIGAAGYAGIWSGPAGGGAAELDYLEIHGCEVAYLTASTCQIGLGECRSDDDTEDMVVNAVLTMNVANTGANGRNIDTAEQANKWYAVYVIKNSGTGAIAGFLINEDDIGGFTWPAGYDKKRRVGWMRNDSSSDFQDFYTDGTGHFRQIFWARELSVRNVLNSGSSTSWSNVDCSADAPPTCRCIWFEHYFDPYSTDQFEIRPDGESYTFLWFSESVLGSGGMWACNCSSSQIIEYMVNSALSDLWLYVQGYIDIV